MRMKYEIGRAFVSWTLADRLDEEYPAQAGKFRELLEHEWWWDITDRVRKQNDISFSFSNPYNEFQPSADDVAIEVEDYDDFVEKLTTPLTNPPYQEDFYFGLCSEAFGGDLGTAGDVYPVLIHYLQTGDVHEYTLLRVSDLDTGRLIYLGVVEETRRKTLYPHKILSIRAYWFPFKWLQKLKITLLPSDMYIFHSSRRLILKGLIEYLKEESDSEGLYKIYSVKYPLHPDYSDVRDTLSSLISESTVNFWHIFGLLHNERRIWRIFPRNPDDGSILIPSIGTYETEVGGWRFEDTPADYHDVKVIRDDEVVERWLSTKKITLSYGTAQWRKPVNCFPTLAETRQNFGKHYRFDGWDALGRRTYAFDYYSVNPDKMFYFGCLPRICDIVWSIQKKVNDLLISPSRFRLYFAILGVDITGEGEWELHTPNDRVVPLWDSEKSVYEMFVEICKYLNGMLKWGGVYYYLLPRDYMGEAIELNPDWVENIVEVNYETGNNESVIPDFGIEWTEQEKKEFEDYYTQRQKTRRLIYRLKIPLVKGIDINLLDEVKADWLFERRYFTGHPVYNKLRVIKKALKLNNSGIYDKIELEVEQI